MMRRVTGHNGTYSSGAGSWGNYCDGAYGVGTVRTNVSLNGSPPSGSYFLPLLDTARVTPVGAVNKTRAWGALACVCLDLEMS